MPADPALVQRIAAQLAAAPKYRHVCPETLERIAAWAAVRYRSDKEILKAAKRKLHQVYAAYLTPKTATRLAALADAPDFRKACREGLALHASTAERLPILLELYPQIFATTGVPRTVLDLACGLHPLALPFMGLDGLTSYRAFDIDCEAMEILGGLFATPLPGVVTTECRDVLVRPPTEPADLAFLLKAVPCLEQQEKGVSLKLLQALRVRHAVVSFPARSLGGRSKGMEEHYETVVEDLLRRLGREASVLRFPSETFYVIELGAASGICTEGPAITRPPG